MLRKIHRPNRPKVGSNRSEQMDKIVSMARNETEVRLAGYRAQSLKLHPWVCARCGRAFSQDNLIELTVHHKDHNHDNNPADGRNWENLCIYCHDNEHARYTDHLSAGGMEIVEEPEEVATHNPFANLKNLLKKDQS